MAPISQPDIDILIVDAGGFIGIELKYVRGRVEQPHIPRLPHYAGIGQSLALLKYGLDSVQLWHCFSADLDERLVARSIGATRSLLYNLQLPIGFAALTVSEEPEQVLLREVHPSLADPPLLKYDHPPDFRRFRCSNPLGESDDAKRVREFIAHVWRIPVA